jgi:hypothetical protein
MSPISALGPDIFMWDTSEERVSKLLKGERQAKCKKRAKKWGRGLTMDKFLKDRKA